MTYPDQPLIVGGGPVGHGAALFLARQGRVPRVVEMRGEPSRQSKALAVSPRTLDILEPTGLTRGMLEPGLPIRGVRFHRQGRAVETVSFTGIHPRYLIHAGTLAGDHRAAVGPGAGGGGRQGRASMLLTYGMRRSLSNANIEYRTRNIEL